MSPAFLLGLYRFVLLTGGLVIGFGLLGVFIWRAARHGSDTFAARRDPLAGLAILGMIALGIVIAGLW